MDDNKDFDENYNDENTENENAEDSVYTEEDKRNDFAHDDIIEMLRSIEDKLNTFDSQFNQIHDMVSMFVQNGAVIRENEDENNIVDDVIDQLSLDNLDLVL